MFSDIKNYLLEGINRHHRLPEEKRNKHPNIIVSI